MNAQMEKVMNLIEEVDGTGASYSHAKQLLHEGAILMSQLDLFPENFSAVEKKLCAGIKKELDRANELIAEKQAESEKPAVTERKENVIYVDFRAKKRKMAA